MLEKTSQKWLAKLSKAHQLPILNKFSPSEEKTPTEEALEGYRRCQTLARKAAQEVASFIQEGWTEKETALLFETYLRDNGVRSFFHRPFVWFGERTRFDGIKSYAAYQPSQRRILTGEVFILDVAPILNGYVCDIGYTRSLGENRELEEAKLFLHEIREKILEFFTKEKTGGAIWEKVDRYFETTGYENIHSKYPFGVLGHRVSRAPSETEGFQVLHFGWQSYWNLVSRGLFGQLLGKFHSGGLTGIWAVEPHIGTKTFGAKFEEILVVDDKGPRWLDEAFI